MDCNTCKNKTKPPETVSFFVHESVQASMERTIKRLWITIILLILMLVGTNGAWLYYESSLEEIEIVQENAEGYNNFIGNDGDIVYGETDNQNTQA